mmetsp:Transcript_9742/g.29472  ORF Transcript_9742/g.29472 Transcript_9742/m.29472 type:complete len:161 (+) Transcript_9742:841-1323(+)
MDSQSVPNAVSVRNGRATLSFTCMPTPPPQREGVSFGSDTAAVPIVPVGCGRNATPFPWCPDQSPLCACGRQSRRVLLMSGRCALLVCGGPSVPKHVFTLNYDVHLVWTTSASALIMVCSVGGIAWDTAQQAGSTPRGRSASTVAIPRTAALMQRTRRAG